MTEQSAQKRARPLSPHLQVYKLPYNALMSIIGRAVGIKLSIATTIILLWLIAVTWLPSIFEPSMAFFKVPFISCILLLGTFVTFFYIGNGIRHVLWDFVIGVHHKTGKVTGNIVLIVSALLTAFVWYVSQGGM